MGDEIKPKDKWDKASIIGQIVSGVLLATIALLIKTGADNISTSLKKGELVQSLISDLAAESDKSIRQDVALIALNHSIGDDEQELVVEIAEQIVGDRQYENVVGSVAYKILEQRAPAKAKEIHERALALAASPGLRADLRSNPDTAAFIGTPTPTPMASPGSRTFPRATPPAPAKNNLIAKVLPHIVLLQFRGEQNRPLAEALQKELAARDLFVPGVDQVEGGYASSIRFFNEEDRSLAEKVAEITRKFFESRNVSINPAIQNLSKSRFPGQPGQIEIWIAP